MKYFAKVVCVFLLVFSLGCNKDDDRGLNKTEGVLCFRGYVERDTLFWVGGEPRDPSGLDFSKLFNETRLSWISVERYLGNSFFFNGDTLEIFVGTLPPARYGYEISNDSIFYKYPGMFGGSSLVFMGTGNTEEVRTQHGLTFLRTFRENGTPQLGGGFEVSNYNYPEMMIGHTNFNGIDQMAENDSLVIINQTKLFN